MISYEEALKMARELKKNIDACDEYDIAYVFKAKEEEYLIGGYGPCCIIKETGRAVNQTEFVDSYDSQFIKGFDL